MILIGQFDSSFVRRVGIALRLYKLPFEHRPWSVFGDTDKVKAYHPLVRVPVLVLDDGESLYETWAILDYLDSLVPAAERLIPAAEPERHRALRVCALSSGLADKIVGLFYEMRLHDKTSQTYETRWRAQIAGALGALEADRAARTGPYWFGDRIGHADIAVAATLRHAAESLPTVVKLDDYPALARYSAEMEALPVFQEISQQFIPPS